MIVSFGILFEVLLFPLLPVLFPNPYYVGGWGRGEKLFPEVGEDVGKWGKARSGACSVGCSLGNDLGEKVRNDLGSWGMIFQLPHRET
jgi:hypothetical protein